MRLPEPAGRLTAEFDYTYQPWSKARYRGYENTPTTFRFTDRSKYALGLELQSVFEGL